MQEIHLDVWIKAERSTVFEAISSHHGLDSWWGPVIAVGREAGELVEFDHSLGAPLQMRIIELVPQERIVWECESEFSDPGNPASEWPGTRITFELQDGQTTGFEKLDEHFAGSRFTVLRFRHTGWSDDANWLAFCNYAWGVTLYGLDQYCSGA